MKPCIQVKKLTLIGLICCSGLTGCFHDDDSQDSQLDTELGNVIATLGLTGDPSLGRNLPNINDPLPQLGKLLFFSKALGGDQDSACVTCHHPVLGGGDDISLSIGVAAVDPDQLGPGRTHDSMAPHYDGGPPVPRNAPTTFNSGLYDSRHFWDGRIEHLDSPPGIRTPDVPFGTIDPEAGSNLNQAQARFPVTSPEEMRGFVFEQGNPNNSVRDHLAARIGNYGIGTGELATNEWLPQFQVAFDPSGDAQTLITFSNITLAIGEYERSQVFVNTPWKAYVEGNRNAMSDAAKRGALLFFRPIDQGGANCASCHSGDFFTDEQFHVLAIPQIGRGKGDGAFGDDDFGHFRESGDVTDMYAFRTPTLLNVTATGPWGHSGAYETLEGIVRHKLNVPQAVAAFDYNQLSQPGIQTMHAVTNTQNALNQLLANRVAGKPLVIQDVELTDAQVNDLLAFLATLTDPCVEDRTCLTPWIADDSDPNPDDLRLNAVDAHGNPL